MPIVGDAARTPNGVGSKGLSHTANIRRPVSHDDPLSDLDQESVES
jgi:hypothetical protein